MPSLRAVRGSSAVLRRRSSDLFAGLVHYYLFEEASGARVDQLGGTSWTVTGAPGRAAGKSNNGSGGTFGANISVGNVLSMAQTALLPGVEFSLGFWLFPVSYTDAAQDIPILVSSSASFGFDLVHGSPTLTSDAVTLKTYPAGTGPSFSTAQNVLPADSQWHSIMISCTARDRILRVDDREVSSTNIGGAALALSAGQTQILSFTATTGTNGRYDEMAVWNRSLSWGEYMDWRRGGLGSFWPSL